MCRSVSFALGSLLALGCGDADVIEGVTEECILDPIVEARIVRGAIDCSPEYSDELPVTVYLAAEQPNDDGGVVQCMRDALASRRDSVYLSQLIAGTDSITRTAKLISANGRANLLTYDSSPSGQGAGGNTVILFDCAPFGVAPDLGCEGERGRRLVCSHDDRVRTTFR